MNDLIADKSMAEAFLHLLDPKGVFTFQTFDDDAKRKNPALGNVHHGTLSQYYEKLNAWNRHGAGVFVMVNEGDGKIHEGTRTCRTNNNVVRIRSIFADLDGAPLEPILQAPAEPQIIVESSPGKWHAYWLTSDTALTEFRGVQKALATKYKSDPAVCDLARVMRLPGFYHRKGESVMTRLMKPASVPVA